mgnify:FL=1
MPTKIARAIEEDPKRRSGVPVITGTRFTLAQLIAEIADGPAPHDFSTNFDQNEPIVRQALHELSVLLNVPLSLTALVNNSDQERHSHFMAPV